MIENGARRRSLLSMTPSVRGVWIALALTSCSVCESLVGAEAAIRSTLLRLEAGFEVPLQTEGVAPIVIRRAKFREAQVFEGREGFSVNAFVDADGEWGETKVSYLGIENIPFARHGTSWQPARPILANLSGIVGVLAAQRSPSATPLKWAIRVDRGVAQIFEETRWDLDGGTPDVKGRGLGMELRDGTWRVKNGADASHLK